MKRRNVNEKVELDEYQTTKACQIRLVKDLEEVKRMKYVKVFLPDPDNI